MTENEWPTKGEILNAIKEGVREAMPDYSAITDAINGGVFYSMPDYSAITEAIAKGAESGIAGVNER